MNTCCKQIRRGDVWHGWNEACGKPAKFTSDDKHYCGLHNPAKQEERRRQLMIKSTARSDRFRLERAAPLMLEALKLVRDLGTFTPATKDTVLAAIAAASPDSGGEK